MIEPPRGEEPWTMILISRSESSGVWVVRSSSLMVPSENTVAMEKYWLSLDFRLT